LAVAREVREEEKEDGLDREIGEDLKKRIRPKCLGRVNE
jgi:hypothetical protein